MRRRQCLSVLLAGLVAGLIAGPAARRAEAIKPFEMEFYARYLKDSSSDPKDKAYVELVHNAKCFLCHEGKSKKTRNPYGRQLAELLNKDTDKENRQKIQEAMDRVARIPCDAKNPKSPTFGDLITSGKLPGGLPKE